MTVLDLDSLVLIKVERWPQGFPKRNGSRAEDPNVFQAKSSDQKSGQYVVGPPPPPLN